MRRFLVVAALTACGPMHHQDNQATNGSDAAQTEMVCRDVRDTGSLMAHRECRPRDHEDSEQGNEDRKATEQMLGKPRAQPTNNH